MKFNDFVYTRPDMEQLSTALKTAIANFRNATDFESANQVFQEVNERKEAFMTMYNICHIRHTINTKDEFYEKENDFFDQNNPQVTDFTNQFYRALLESPFKADLQKKWGSQLFVIAELSLKTFQPTILEDLQKENNLISEYVKLKASAAIEFEGNTYNLSSIIPLETADDRTTRKKASHAKWNFFETHSAAVERIYHDQVQVRHQIAQKLGYKNFVELGYARMLRSDYNAEKVANFRQQVLDYIVPLATKLYQRQQNRLGLDDFFFYDEKYIFASGNPTPKGSPEWIVNHAKTMYKELSGETDEFFQFMNDNDLMDLVNKEGKATGGYCTYIGNYKAPYIFSNFNGTSGDIDVLTHEAGHAFQVYSSRDIGIGEYNWPTYEACEIHSMSMEFFTWPWMHLFFEEDVQKYKFSHLAGAICFLPYGVAVDEFQHVVYENPTMSIEERNAAWRAIEKKYLPHRNYEGYQFLEEGRFWQRQSHIFSAPFYYIDYTLAQICAFQFWKKDNEDHKSAWTDYVRLCKAGGSQSFLDLVRLANLRSPFEDGCVASVVGMIEEWLDRVDDTKF